MSAVAAHPISAFGSHAFEVERAAPRPRLVLAPAALARDSQQSAAGQASDPTECSPWLKQLRNAQRHFDEVAGSATSCNLELQLAYHRLQDTSLLCWLIGESTTHCRSFAVELKAHESPTVLRDRGTDQ
jgi:hypothetical protein